MTDKLTFGEVQDWRRAVLRIPSITPSAKLCAVVIADHVNREHGIAYPSQETIAECIGMTARHVKNLLKELRNVGVIEADRSHGRRSATVYRLAMPGPKPAPEGNNVSPLRGEAQFLTQRNERGTERGSERGTTASREGKYSSPLNPLEHGEPTTGPLAAHAAERAAPSYPRAPKAATAGAAASALRPEHGAPSEDFEARLDRLRKERAQPRDQAERLRTIEVQLEDPRLAAVRDAKVAELVAGATVIHQVIGQPGRLATIMANASREGVPLRFEDGTTATVAVESVVLVAAPEAA